MAKTAFTVNVRIDGVRETLAAFRALPKDANDELRVASLRLAELLAVSARTAATARGGVAALMAPTVKAARDRVPVVQAGGSRKVGRNRVPAWQVLFVGEFGMDKRTGWYAAPRFDDSDTLQTPRHTGRTGRWFFPTVERESTAIGREWNAAADRILNTFSKGGA